MHRNGSRTVVKSRLITCRNSRPSHSRVVANRTILNNNNNNDDDDDDNNICAVVVSIIAI